MRYDVEKDYQYTSFEPMMTPQLWEDIVNGPCYVINLDRNPKRWETAQEKIKNAGFTNVHRISAVDGKNPLSLQQNWNDYQNPSFAEWDQEFVQYPGKQGCFLSHMKIWKKMIDERIPWVTILEDDVLFHSQWNVLAPKYFELTPKDFDVLYLGAQFEFESSYHIDCGPVFCTHAMIVTYNGAKKLYEMCLNKTGGVYTVDCMIIDMMKFKLHFQHTHSKAFPFTWYVWNGIRFFPTEQINMPKGWTKRNCGLVFQDESYGSEVRPW